MPPRRGGGGGAGADAALFLRLADPVLNFGDDLVHRRRPDPGALAGEAGTLLDLFEGQARRAGIPEASVPAARYGLAVVLDEAARRNRAIPVKAWAATAGPRLFDGRDVSLAGLRDLARKAEEAGPEYAGLHDFLGECIARVEAMRGKVQRRQHSGVALALVGLLGFLVVAAAAAALNAEWRFHRGLARGFAAEAERIGPVTLDLTLPEIADRLDRLAAAAATVEAQLPQAPLGLFGQVDALDAGARAHAAYADAVAGVLPVTLAAAIDLALATEGDGLDAYDTLRAWSILSGQGPWSATYLKGWIAARPDLDAGFGALAPHALALQGPAPDLPPPDAEIRVQAQGFAAEVGEGDRAWLELRRSDAVAALPGWVADQAVPGIGDVLLRRSGKGLDTPVPGLFTPAGWAHARDFGAGLAVQTTREQAPLILAAAPRRENDAPDRVMDALQAETLRVWEDWLADLRVRPFADTATSVLVSGRLATRQSPLTALLSEVWAQVGGNDRTRPHASQLKIAAAFGPMIQYVESGRMTAISDLFAALNVALGSIRADEERALERLMNVQERAQSVAALADAPAVVVRIVEDVLAQSSAAHADALRNPVARRWQAEVFAACHAVVDGQFPFADGPDSDLLGFAALFGPGGRLDRFMADGAGPMIDMTVSPWRWKPEARFGGLQPETAAFFQRAAAVSEAFFPAGAPEPTASLSLAALAERGQAFVRLGGQGAPVQTSSGAAELVWPGPDPAAGVDFSFSSATTPAVAPGPWGLFRLMAGLRLRERDDGRRFLVDLKTRDARLFLELSFATEVNPLSRWSVIRGLTCPPAL